MSHHFFVPLFLDLGAVSYFPITRQSYYDEAIFYAPRANAVYQGALVNGDLGVYEYKNAPTVFPMVSPMIMGLLAKSLGSLSAALIFSDFLFPALIFLLLYVICFEVTQRKTPSLIFATLFIFAPKLAIYIPPITALNLRGVFESFFPFLNPAKLHFSEFEEPKITFIFFAMSFYAIVRALRREERRFAIIAGVSFGAMFYTYLYDWVSFFAALSIALFLFVVIRDWARAKIIVMITGLGFAVSSYYWFNIWQVYHLPYAHDVIARAGGEYSHQFRFLTVWKSYLRNIVLAGAVWFVMFKKISTTAILLLGFLGAYFVVVNVQVITGFNPFPDHWYRTQFLPLGLILFLLALALWDWYFVRIKRFGPHLAFMFLLYFFGAYFLSQYSYSKVNAEAFAVPRARLESMEWLNNHTSRYAVVGAIEFPLNNDIVLYTHNKIFVPTFSVATPSNEVWTRYMFIAKCYGVTPQEFETSLRESGAVYFLFMEQYGDHSFDASFLNYDRKFPEPLIKEKVEDYSRYAANSEVEKPPFRLDYLYFDTHSFFGRDPKKNLPRLNAVYENKGIVIYQYAN